MKTLVPIKNNGSVSTFPLVSVILVNYNYGKYIKQSINSVLNQSYENIELIVVDDGSTDDSPEVIRSYGNQLTAIFQSNAGQESAANVGIKKSTGEIICFLDSDDYFHLEKINRIVNGFKQHPEWVQIGHPWLSVNSKGEIIGKATSDVLNQGDVRQILLKWGKYSSAISSGLACRRSVLEKVMPFKQGWGVDTYLNVTVPFHGMIGCINKPLMYYRMHGNNMRAYNDNLDYLIQQREAAAAFINEVASGQDLSKRFELENDPDYLSYKIMRDGPVSFFRRFKVIALSLQESFELHRSLRDMFIRLIYRGFGAFCPSHGKLLLRYGFRGYLRFKLLGNV